ncbi:hypothetical protein DITRI_Ditri17bG0044900 [Diplodiscus trichospermus]
MARITRPEMRLHESSGVFLVHPGVVRSVCAPNRTDPRPICRARLAGCDKDAIPKECYNKIWRLSFYSIIWSIWIMRNDMIFNRKLLDFQQLINGIKFRVASWARAKWSNIQYGVLDIVRFPQLVKTPDIVKAARPNQKWSRPQPGFLKFNVDGSALGKLGLAGIGGVLRDSLASWFIVFSKLVGTANSNVAELLAIKEAMIIYSKSVWAQSPCLIIECDSKNAVFWTLNLQQTP